MHTQKSKLEFASNLVKGKIAETIFEQMLRHTEQFTVLNFGYEHIVPELARSHDETSGLALEIIRRAPDFAVINHETRKVNLIEVKYHWRLNKKYILKDAQRMIESWNPSSLFIATRDGFYFDDIETIIKNDGEISILKHKMISQELQEEYLKILVEFEK